MKRFLLILAAVAAVFTSCCNVKCCKEKSCKEKACCHCAKPGDKEIGVQLYSVRELIGNPELYAANHEQVFKDLASYGYTAVEPAGFGDGKFYGVAPEQFKADVEAAGMKVVSSHTSYGLSEEQVASGDFSEALNWWKEALPAHAATGMKYVVMAGFRVPSTLAGLKVYCDYFNEIGKLCKENGLQFGYHNHSHEFEKLEGKVIYDFMLENTDPELVFFEMDVYWAVMGRVSPVNYFKANPGRFKALHIKDYREVGQSGMVGFDAIFANAETAGLTDFVVEMEGSSYDDIMRTSKESAEYLLKMPFVKASYNK